MPSEADADAAQELTLFVDNDGDLYRQQTQPIFKNLRTKMAQGKYDREKAVKLFMYLAESGAKKYAKEFADGREWNQIFSVPARRLAAAQWRDSFEVDAQLGNYDNYLPKKYQAKTVPKMMSVAKIESMVQARGRSTKLFWQEACGGDVGPLPQKDVERVLNSL